MKKILILLLPLLMAGCGGDIKRADNAIPISQEEYNPVGDYVYIRTLLFEEVVHTNLYCSQIGNSNPDRVKVSDYSHTYIDSSGDEDTHEYCRYCVSDEQYEFLLAIDTIK